jgi:CBS domain containing-hemolysin-like protein
LEDLIEEIVGEISDEHDATKEGIVEWPDGSIMIDGRVEIEVVEDYYGVEFKEGRYETLSGLILNDIKKIPVAGEVIYIDNFEMIIDSADERSIGKVRIRKMSNDGAGRSEI